MRNIITALAGLGIAPATTVVAAPTAVKGAPGNLTATIFWAPPTSNGGSPMTSYHLYANGVSKEVSAATKPRSVGR